MNFKSLGRGTIHWRQYLMVQSASSASTLALDVSEVASDAAKWTTSYRRDVLGSS